MSFLCARKFREAAARVALCACVCAAVALRATAAEEGQPCVAVSPVEPSAFDPAVDYFPVKAQATEARGWTISYHRSFKVLLVQDQAYVLTLKGAPVPTEAQLSSALPASVSAVKQFAVPLQTMALAETVANALAAQLGLAPRATAVVSGYSVSACARTVLANASRDFDAIGLDQAAAEADVMFGSSCGSFEWAPPYTFHPCADAAQQKFALFLNTFERSFLAASDWLGMLAAFFNLECAATRLHSTVTQTYTCTKALVTTQKAPVIAAGQGPLVAFIRSSGATCSVINDNGKYEHLVAELGGRVMAAAQFPSAAALKAALVGAGVHAVVVRDYSVADAATVLANYQFADVPFKVFDLAGVQNAAAFASTDEFDGLLAEPDLLLQEMAAVLYPDLAPTLLSAASLQYRWLRDLQAPLGAPTIPSAADCTLDGFGDGPLRQLHATPIQCA